MRRIIAFLLLAVPILGREPKPGFNLFSKDQDVQIGREAAAQVERQVRVVRNPELQEYVSRVGRRLAATRYAGQFPYKFTLIEDKSINAFALPGGPVYVHTGLLLAAENEAQAAGVLAHEISHVALRHGTSQASKAAPIQLIAGVLGATTGGGLMGQLAQLGIGLGANSVLLKYSRGAERDADALGARIMAAAGYNPIEMARFFEKLEAEGGSRGPEFLSSHPKPGNRVKLVEQEIREIPQSRYDADSGEFQRMKALLGSSALHSRPARGWRRVGSRELRPRR